MKCLAWKLSYSRPSGYPSAVRLPESTELLVAADVRKRESLGFVRHLATRLVSNWRNPVQSLVGPVAVIKLQKHFAKMDQVRCAKDHEVIEQFVAEGLDELLGLRQHAGSAVGDLHRLRPLAEENDESSFDSPTEIDEALAGCDSTRFQPAGTYRSVLM